MRLSPDATDIATFKERSQRRDAGHLLMNTKVYYVYIMTNRYNRVIYTGVTSDLKRRVWEHKEKIIEGFTKRYNVTKLVYYELFEDVNAAISREKQIKAGSRQKKIDLIRSMNEEWRDLYEKL